MSSETHATLLERLRDGSDPLAWEQFSDRYWRSIFAFAKCRGCSDHTAEDVVQEVLLAVFQQRQVFRYDPARGRFRDWLGAVVRNQVAKRRQQPSERVRARGGDSDDHLPEPEGKQQQPDAAWEAVFEQAVLAALMDIVRREVAPPTYQAFELLALKGLSGSEIAKITGLSRNAVYLAHRRVLKRLRELGTTYRDEGRLNEHLRQALAARPSPSVERSMTDRIEETLQRWRGITSADTPQRDDGREFDR